MTKKLEEQIANLLELAKVPSERRGKARDDLAQRIRIACHNAKTLHQRKNPQDHNDPFDAIEKASTSLKAAIKDLDKEPNKWAHVEFWSAHFLVPGLTAVQALEANLDPKQVFGLLDKIETTARGARVSRIGRPEALVKQVLVRQAYLAFEAIKSPELKASQYHKGSFYRFAELFCEAAEGKDVGPIDRQVRQVLSGSRRK